MPRKLPENPTVIWVVAAGLIGEDGRVLVQRRPPGTIHGGLWEFPGGKVERGETARAALVRELGEELGVQVAESELSPVGFADRAGEATVILLYTCRRWAGEPQAADGAALRWASLDEIALLPMPPLDVDLIPILRSRLERGG